jgi:hypothetical protein
MPWPPGWPPILTPSDVDCATTVMLKILDGKCKMSETDKVVMAALYDAVKHRPASALATNCTRSSPRPAPRRRRAAGFHLRKRVLAETTLSRPVMKAFKAMIRAEGLFAGLEEEDADA